MKRATAIGILSLLALPARGAVAEDKPSLFRFTDVSEEVGLAEPFRGAFNHAIAWGDFDNDGRPDMFYLFVNRLWGIPSMDLCSCKAFEEALPGYTIAKLRSPYDWTTALPGNWRIRCTDTRTAPESNCGPGVIATLLESTSYGLAAHMPHTYSAANCGAKPLDYNAPARSRSMNATQLLALPCLFTAPTDGDPPKADPMHAWAQWRGPLGTGFAPNAQPPVEWSEIKNVRWKTEPPGKGHSTPIVWDGTTVRIVAKTGHDYGDSIRLHAIRHLFIAGRRRRRSTLDLRRLCPAANDWLLP